MDPSRRRTLLTTTTPETLNHFLSQPKHHPLLHDPAFTPIPTPSRKPNPSTEDSFFAETLQTPHTIHFTLSFYRPPVPSSLPLSLTAPQRQSFEELRTLLSIGSGINGHSGIAHGGFLVTVLDELMGAAVYRHRHRSSVTATLKVDFKRPVRTPGMVVCSVGLVRVEGRKLWVSGQVEDADEGEVLVRAKGMWVEIRDKEKEKAML